MQSEESATARALSDQVQSPRAILKPTPKPRLYTLGEYLRREERAVERHEYYDGKIIRLPASRGPQNIIAANITTAINIATEPLPKQYRVLSSNQIVYLPGLNFGLYPDALVVCEIPEF